MEIDDLQVRLNRTLSRSENNALRKIRCVIHPWRGHKPATRSDVWRLFQRYYETNVEPFYSLFVFVGWHGWSRSFQFSRPFPYCHDDPRTDMLIPNSTLGNDDTKIGLIQWNYNEPPPTRRETIEVIANLWVKNVDGDTHGPSVCRNYNDPEFEL